MLLTGRSGTMFRQQALRGLMRKVRLTAGLGITLCLTSHSQAEVRRLMPCSCIMFKQRTLPFIRDFEILKRIGLTQRYSIATQMNGPEQ